MATRRQQPILSSHKNRLSKKGFGDPETGSGNYASVGRFLVVFLATLVGFFLVSRLDIVERRIVDPYLVFIGKLSRFALRSLGVDASGSGTAVSSPQFAVNIVDLCSGLGVTAVFLAAVVGFPATWRSKLAGLAVGYPVLFLVNLFRIVVLFMIGTRRPDLFDDAHYYYSQAFVMFASVATWLLWVSVFTGHGTKSRSPLPR